MPAYNAEKTIRDSIESVIKQSFLDFELLICDDGSSDLTRKIIKEFSDIDSRVKIIDNVFNKGAAGARNSCLKYSKSRFVAFLDSDDLWGRDKLKVQLKFMLDNDVSISHGEYIMFNDGSDIKKIKPPSIISYQNILKRCEIGCLTVMIDTSKVEEFYFPFLPKEDYALWVSLLKKGHVSCLYPECLARYRKQEKSLSSSKFREISKQWIVLEEITSEPFFKRFFYILTYAFNGVRKHFLMSR